MDIQTLNAVIEKLKKREEMATFMLNWAMRESTEEDQKRWSTIKCEANLCRDEVEMMLNHELKDRDRYMEEVA